MGSPSSPMNPTPPPPPPPAPSSDPPSAVPLPLPPPAPAATSSRRLPPPCWSNEETIALIESYRDKWHSLGRGNLKAPHWQEVADSVTSRCPNASPAKTAVQCRHKMEKLRKRYRTEVQRARSMPVSRFNSSWVHFKRMDFMEKVASNVKGGNHSNNNNNSSNHNHNNNNSDNSPDEADDDDDEDLYEEFKNAAASGGGGGGNIGGSNIRSLNKLYRNGGSDVGVGVGVGGGGGGGGFRIRIPTGVSIAQPGVGNKFYGKVGDRRLNSGNTNSGPGGGTYGGWGMEERIGMGKRERERERERGGDAVGEMVNAIKVLGDGFVRMEQMKMEMAREIETMRMEMEMKRTEMILESQQRIVEAFAKAVSEKKSKKVKRMASPSGEQP